MSNLEQNHPNSASRLSLHWNVKDITGQRFGRWTAIRYQGKSYWLCRCDCGTEKPVFTGNLTGEKSLSCGCLRDEIVSKNSSTHGLAGSAEYKVWAGIKRRCLNKNEGSYSRYGARGITICQQWSDSFESFLADMGNRPSPKHWIERINNDRGYEPNNCRWATRTEQARNTRRNRLITLGDETKPLAEWAEITGIKRATIAFRLDTGWPVERALALPPKMGRNQFG